MAVPRPTLSELSGLEDDVSLMTEDVVDEHVAGPASWDDVVVEELKSIAGHIARNSMPSAIGLEAGGGVDAGPRFAAADKDEANQDPLGYGRIDVQLLALVRPDGTRGPIAKTQSLLDGRRELNRKGSFTGRKGQYSKLRNKVLPTSNQFEPFAYLGIVHTDTSLQELVQGADTLRRQMTEQSSQLKSLVRENFERFISCKTTIDDIEKGLRQAERGGGDGTNTTQVLDALKEVTEDAHHAFKPMLERQGHIETIHSNMSLLKRYEQLFRMPLRLKQHAQNKDYDQLITEYRNAKSILAGLSQLPNGEVWNNLFLEVDKTVEVLCVDLLSGLESGSANPAESLGTIKHVLQLQAEQLEALQGVDPLDMYLKGQEDNIVKDFKQLADDHRSRMAGAKMQSEVASAEGSGQQGSASSGRLESQSSSNAQMQPIMEDLIVKHVAQLTAVLVRKAPSLWYMSQERLSSIPGIGSSVNEVIEIAPERVDAAVSMVVNVYREQVLAAVMELEQCPPTGPAPYLLSVIQQLVTAVESLQDTDAPDTMYIALQGIAVSCCEVLMARLQNYLTIVWSKISSAKSWELAGNNSLVIDGKAIPISQASDWLRGLLSGVLDAMDSAYQKAAAVGVQYVEAISPPASRMLFFDSVAAFAVALDKLTNQQELAASEVQMLNLLSVSTHARSQIIPELMTRYSHIMVGDGNEEEAAVLSGDAITDLGVVGSRLLLSYKDRRHHLLDTALEEYFFGDGMMWDAAPMPAGVRNTAVDLLHSFVKVEGDVFVHAPMVLDQIMMDLVQHLFQAFPPVLSSQLQHISPGGLLQLWLEAHYFEKVLGRFLTPQVEEILDNVKAILWQRIDECDAKGASDPPLMEWMQLHEQRLLDASLNSTKFNTFCFFGEGLQRA